MKRFACLSLGLLMAATASVCAESVGTIITLLGKTYHDCHIVRVHPDGVSFTHSNGAAKVLFDDLSTNWRKTLGYDPQKEEAYEREIADRRRREADARAARDLELAKALAAANQMEVERLRTQRIQALGAQGLAFSSQWPWTMAVPGFDFLPPLGAIHDGRDIHRRLRHRGISWDARGLAPLAPGVGGVVAFPSGGIQFFAPGMWSSPTLGQYVPGARVPVSLQAGLGLVGHRGGTSIPVSR